VGRPLVDRLAKVDDVIATYHAHPPASGPANVTWHALDVRDSASVDAFVAEVRARLTRVTVVNLAAVSTDALAVRMTADAWDDVMAVNLRGAFVVTRALLPVMIREQWGRIITVSSVVTRLGVAGTSAYAASKAGVVGFTRTLATEYARFNVTANCLMLGYFDTGLIDRVPERERAALLERIPLRRLGDVDDIARAVSYLIDAGYVTGTTLEITGGLTA